MKKRYNAHLATLSFLEDQESREQENKTGFVSDVGICYCYYLSLTLGTPEFKQLDLSCSFHRYQLRWEVAESAIHIL